MQLTNLQEHWGIKVVQVLLPPVAFCGCLPQLSVSYSLRGKKGDSYCVYSNMNT